MKRNKKEFRKDLINLLNEYSKTFDYKKSNDEIYLMNQLNLMLFKEDKENDR